MAHIVLWFVNGDVERTNFSGILVLYSNNWILQVILRPISKVLITFLKVMQKNGYINDFTIIDDARNGKVVVDLNGRLNKCGVISPRFDLKLKNFENFTAAVLPSRQFGHVVLTTNVGIMDHKEAQTKQIGGKVLGYFY